MITFKFIINSRLGAYLKFIIYEYQTFCVYDIEVFPLFSVRLQSLDHVIVNGREVRGGGNEIEWLFIHLSSLWVIY